MKPHQLNVKTSKPLTVADFTALGGTLAHALFKADMNHTSSKREILIASASKYAGHVEAVKALLDGMATTYLGMGYTDGQVRARKSEAKAVYDAVALTQLSGANIALLNDFKGGYADFIGYARDLRDANKPEKVPSDKVPVDKPLTDLQLQDVEDKLKRLDVQQVIGFTKQLSNQVPQYTENQALTGLRQFDLIVNITSAMMNSDKLDDYTKHLALSVNAQVLEGVATITKALQQASQVTENMEYNPYDVKAV